MNSVLATLATHWVRPAVSPQSRALGAFGRKGKRSLGTAILIVLGHAYRAAQRAQMRRIRMELALHGMSARAEPRNRSAKQAR
jgi:hypothetical protein